MLADTDELLAPMTRIDGFVLACLVDASTGTTLAARQDRDGLSLPAAAAGAADVIDAVTLLSARLGADDQLEDVMLAFGEHIHVICLPGTDLEPRILLLVVLDRLKTNLAMARREIRDFCASFTS